MHIPRRYFRNDVPFFGSPNSFAEIFGFLTSQSVFLEQIDGLVDVTVLVHNASTNFKSWYDYDPVTVQFNIT